jgi:uncharacterized protein (PEP-CTERM system associated)
MRVRTLVVLTACLASATGVAAQTFLAAEPGTTPGWVFTPTFVVSTAHDDNVTLAGRNAPTASDTLTVLTPAGDLQYRGRYTWIDLGYDGSWSLYRQLNALNSFDQSLRTDSRIQLSRRVSFVLHDGLSFHPTTDVVDLSGVPFLRTGSRMDDGRAEVRMALTPHTTAGVAYTLEWVRFDRNVQFARFLHGGVAHGVSGHVDQQLTARLTVGGVYDFRRAIVSDNAGRFDIQNAAGTFTYLALPTLTLSGSLGIARLTDAAGLNSRTGPSWRIAAEQRLERATVAVSYLRSYVPSFGLGGTLQNEELNASLHMPLARNRLYWQAGLSWRRNEPITAGEQTLKSLWVQTWIGYSVRRWLRVEGYLWRSQQDSQLAGGRVDRDRVGLQLVVALPMRLE